MKKLLIGILALSSISAFAGDCTYSHGLWSNQDDLIAYKVIDGVMKRKGYQLVESNHAKYQLNVSANTSQNDRFNVPQNMHIEVSIEQFSDSNSIYEKMNRWMDVKIFKLGLKSSIKRMVSDIPSCGER